MKDICPFLAIPTEIHLEIFSYLNPIDSVVRVPSQAAVFNV